MSVREKHKTVIVKGSNGYNLVHSEVKIHLGNTNLKRRKVCHPIGSQPRHLAVCPCERKGETVVFQLTLV